jgi:predicted nucleic acid-binding protein
MSVLVDTSIWSLALRRKSAQLAARERKVVAEWKKVVEDGRARLTGIIRQELLSGIREANDFERLRDRLADFDDLPVSTPDHERAARFFNTCRAKGVSPTAVDMLICAVAVENRLAVFTTDADFPRYAAILSLRLHTVPAGH